MLSRRRANRKQIAKAKAGGPSPSLAALQNAAKLAEPSLENELAAAGKVWQEGPPVCSTEEAAAAAEEAAGAAAAAGSAGLSTPPTYCHVHRNLRKAACMRSSPPV